jgi:ribosomal protein S27AE
MKGRIMANSMQRCCICGEEIGPFLSTSTERDTCGRIACDRTLWQDDLADARQADGNPTDPAFHANEGA